MFLSHPALLWGAGASFLPYWKSNFRKQGSKTVLSKSYWQPLTEVQTSVPTRPPQAICPCAGKGSSVRWDGKNKIHPWEILRLQNLAAAWNMRSMSKTKGQEDDNMLTMSNVFGGIFILSFWFLCDRYDEFYNTGNVARSVGRTLPPTLQAFPKSPVKWEKHLTSHGGWIFPIPSDTSLIIQWGKGLLIPLSSSRLHQQKRNYYALYSALILYSK